MRVDMDFQELHRHFEASPVSDLVAEVTPACSG